MTEYFCSCQYSFDLDKPGNIDSHVSHSSGSATILIGPGSKAKDAPIVKLKESLPSPSGLPLVAPPPSATPVSPTLKIPSAAVLKVELGKYCDELEKLPYFTGVILVKQGDEVLVHRAMGEQVKEGKIDGNTRFNCASVGKMFTSLAIHQLALESKEPNFLDRKLSSIVDRNDLNGMNFDDPDSRNPIKLTSSQIDELLSSGITINQLLTHTAGLSRKAPFSNEPLRPNSGYSYSNFGYELLSAVIKKISGTPFADFIQEKILGRQPESKGLFPRYEGSIAGEVTYLDEEKSHVPHNIGCGCWDISAPGLVDFVERNYKTLDEFTREALPNPNNPSASYGSGVEIIRENGLVFKGHNGNVPGGETDCYWTENKIPPIIIVTYKGGYGVELNHNLKHILSGQPIPSGREPGASVALFKSISEVKLEQLDEFLKTCQPTPATMTGRFVTMIKAFIKRGELDRATKIARITIDPLQRDQQYRTLDLIGRALMKFPDAKAVATRCFQELLNDPKAKKQEIEKFLQELAS